MAVKRRELNQRLPSYLDLLKLVATNLDSKGMFCEIISSGNPIPSPGEHLVVTDAWAMFSRPRSNNFLFQDLQRLQQRLSEQCEVPVGPGALVTPPSDDAVEFGRIRFRGLSSRGGSADAKSEELFFPPPYNEEQITIVHRLERSAGVTVQGPPGTGKTHTIANIICHYLATGRRVLVTSRGEPALAVLQSKIPEEVRPLTVALLASDRDGVKQFKASIDAIQHQVSQLNPEITSEEIETLFAAIDRSHFELAVIDRRIDEIALTQLAAIEIDGRSLRPQELAELVVSGAERFAWFDDSVDLVEDNSAPLSDQESAELRSARRRLGTDLVYVCAEVPSADSLPSAIAIAEPCS